MKTLKTTAVLLMLIAFTLSSLFATGAKEMMEKNQNQAIVEEIVEEIKEERIHYAEINKEDMISAFNYAYGYTITKGILSQGISLNGAYWLRGFSDFLEGAETPLVATEEMNSIVEEYSTTYYQAGLSDGPGVMPNREELSLLAAPESILDKFSYSYGIMYAIQLYYYNGLDITAPEFMEGAADALWENPDRVMTDEEINSAIDAYAQYLDSLYQEYITEVSATNLAEAEAFLESNKANEGIIILPSGCQMTIVSEDEVLGDSPLSTDSVVVDYDLFLLDGSQVDGGEGVTFSLQNLIPGFTEAVTNMKVGQEAVVYIHPDYGYGANGSNSIEPNALLIFRIKLNSIVK